jgi:hypothetical protein
MATTRLRRAEVCAAAGGGRIATATYKRLGELAEFTEAIYDVLTTRSRERDYASHAIGICLMRMKRNSANKRLLTH